MSKNINITICQDIQFQRKLKDVNKIIDHIAIQLSPKNSITSQKGSAHKMRILYINIYSKPVQSLSSTSCRLAFLHRF